MIAAVERKHSSLDKLLNICPKLSQVGRIDVPVANDSLAMPEAPWVVVDTNLSPKVDMGSMDIPIFAMRPEKRTLIEWRLGDLSLKMKFGPDGQPCIRDKDLWIFLTTQVVSAINAGRAASSCVRFKSYSFLKAVGWGVDGRAYQRLRQALSRLKGTTIETNVAANNKIFRGWFGLLESAEMVVDDHDASWVEIVLPQWLMESIRQRRVLTLHKQYFDMPPFARVIYQIVRLRCGNQSRWSIGLNKLHIRSGSYASKKEFCRCLRRLCVPGALPGYQLSIDERIAVFSSVGRKGMER